MSTVDKDRAAERGVSFITATATPWERVQYWTHRIGQLLRGELQCGALERERQLRNAGEQLQAAVNGLKPAIETVACQCGHAASAHDHGLNFCRGWVVRHVEKCRCKKYESAA